MGFYLGRWTSICAEYYQVVSTKWHANVYSKYWAGHMYWNSVYSVLQFEYKDMLGVKFIWNHWQCTFEFVSYQLVDMNVSLYTPGLLFGWSPWA